MFCPNCGNQLSDTAAFCTKCGTRLAQQPGAQAQPEQPRMSQPASRDDMLAAQKQAFQQQPTVAAPQQDYQQYQQQAPSSGGFNSSECVSLAWAAVKANLGMFLGGTILYMIIAAAGGVIPLGSLILTGPLMGGFYVFCFRGMDGKPEIGDLFRGFSRFLPLMLAYLVSAIIIAVGMVLLIIPGIYLAVCYSFTQQLILDRNLDFWDAMETSRKTVSQCWGSVFMLWVICFFVALLGVLALGVGIFVAIPVISCARNYAYTQLFGRANQLP